MQSLIAVAEIIRQVASEVIVPRFRDLRPEDIVEKNPGDLVTIADRDSEYHLSHRLVDFMPGSKILGEEMAYLTPTAYEVLNGIEPVWVIDPIDGTGNFAKGDERFAVIIALVRQRTVEAGWIYEPISGRTVAAERQKGCWNLGAQVEKLGFSTSLPHHQAVGAVYGKRTVGSGDHEISLVELVEKSPEVGSTKQYNSGGVEYNAIAMNDIAYSLHSRSYPWDHAAGALMVEEAGGVAKFLDGSPYDPYIIDREILAAQSGALFDTVQRLVR
ncbi:MAG: inositol monophosphatase [Alphaproteobacteria bacterium]|nr:inositol monophosphatase [Alphaproteobacteria bacterium]